MIITSDGKHRLKEEWLKDLKRQYNILDSLKIEITKKCISRGNIDHCEIIWSSKNAAVGRVTPPLYKVDF